MEEELTISAWMVQEDDINIVCVEPNISVIDEGRNAYIYVYYLCLVEFLVTF